MALKIIGSDGSLNIWLPPDPSIPLDDVLKLHQMCLDENLFIYPSLLCGIWRDYSDSMAAGWMSIPDNAIDIIKSYLYLLPGFARIPPGV